MIKNRRNRRYASGCLSSAEKAITAVSSMTDDPHNNGFLLEQTCTGNIFDESILPFFPASILKKRGCLVFIETAPFT
jgi:hypothetical protein